MSKFVACGLISVDGPKVFHGDTWNKEWNLISILKLSLIYIYICKINISELKHVNILQF
jgi:hypothetical protein